MVAVLGDSMGTLQKGGFGKHHEVTPCWFLIKQHTHPPTPFAEAEQDLMESLDFFL